MGVKVTRRNQRKARGTRRKQRGGVGGKPAAHRWREYEIALEKELNEAKAREAERSPAWQQRLDGPDWEREEARLEQQKARNLHPGFTETLINDEYHTDKLIFLYHTIEEVINSEFQGKSKERMLRILKLLRRPYSIDTPTVYTVSIDPVDKKELTELIKSILENGDEEMSTLLQQLYVVFNDSLTVTE